MTNPNEIAIGVTSIPPAFWIIGKVQSIAVAPRNPQIAVERKWRINNGMTNKLTISRDKSLKKGNTALHWSPHIS